VTTATPQSDDSRPVPDPTLLTTAALNREIGHLKELHDLRFQLIEMQRLESKSDSKEALAAALATAKESVTNLTKTYEDGHASVSSAVLKLQNDMTQLIAMGLGRKESGSESQGRLALILSGLVLVVMVVNEFVVHVGH
jgi:hypothetical protein